MGKKRIEKITRLSNEIKRKVTLCKRKKGLIKKMIELSVLCDLKIFMLIQDDENQRTTHFLSHQDFNFVNVFNEMNQREFYSNRDYERVGGIKEELDSDFQLSDGETVHDFQEIDEDYLRMQSNLKQVKIFSTKRKELLCTSRIGNFKDQKK